MDSPDEHDARHVSSDDSEHGQTDPTAFRGGPSAWLAATHQDRLVANSLDAVRNTDLAVHLYNSHALRQRAWDAASVATIKDWHSKDRWIKKGSDQTAFSSDVFVPARGWTAWPLPPELVPREGERVGLDDGLEASTFKRPDDGRPSQVLQELLTATITKLAKRAFLSREEVLESTRSAETQPPEPRETDPMSVDSTCDSKADINSAEPDEALKSPNRHSEPRQPSPRASLRPAVLADEDAAARLAEPATRHVLSRLDDLLMALHHARAAALRGREGSESPSEGEASEPLPPKKRPRGRPRKHPLSDREADETVDTVASSPAPKKKGRGRPRKDVPLLAGETEYERSVRVAKLRKQAIPSANASSMPSSPLPFLDSDDNMSRSRAGSRMARRQPDNLGLRDWSEIVSAAALIGFPREVITRTTQRCATLFNESMSLRFMEEQPTEQGWDVVQSYRPSLVPDLSVFTDEVDSDSASDVDSGIARAAFIVSPFVCLGEDCAQAFLRPHELRHHLENDHKYEQSAINDHMAVCDEKWQRSGTDTDMLAPIYDRGWDAERSEPWAGPSVTLSEADDELEDLTGRAESSDTDDASQ